MQVIALTQGKETLVSDNDYPTLNALKWFYTPSGYAAHSFWIPALKRCNCILLHRYILGLTDPKIECDHIDLNPLNNQRENLRIVTRAQNNYNRIAYNKPNTAIKSNYKGLHWYTRTNKWQVHITFNNKKIHIGYFTNEIDAALAYNAKALALFGEFARLNEV